MHEHSVEAASSEVAALIHEQAEMRLLVSHGELLRGRAAIIQALETGREAAMYRAQVTRFEWLDEVTVLSFGNARHALDGSGFTEATVVWLDQLRDGLLWRMQAFRHDADARRAYEDQQRQLVEDAAGEAGP